MCSGFNEETMNINLIPICGICVIASVLCSLFGNIGKEYTVYIRLAAAAAVLAIIILYISPVAETIHMLYEKAGADEEYLTILFKALGICYITQFAGDICKDCGENTLAVQTETAGKIALLILALPLFNSLAEIISNLI